MLITMVMFITSVYIIVMNLLLYFLIIKQNWLLVAVCTSIGLCLAIVFDTVFTMAVKKIVKDTLFEDYVETQKIKNRK